MFYIPSIYSLYFPRKDDLVESYKNSLSDYYISPENSLYFQIIDPFLDELARKWEEMDYMINSFVLSFCFPQVLYQYWGYMILDASFPYIRRMSSEDYRSLLKGVLGSYLSGSRRVSIENGMRLILQNEEVYVRSLYKVLTDPTDKRIFKHYVELEVNASTNRAWTLNESVNLAIAFLDELLAAHEWLESLKIVLDINFLDEMNGDITLNESVYKIDRRGVLEDFGSRYIPPDPGYPSTCNPRWDTFYFDLDSIVKNWDLNPPCDSGFGTSLIELDYTWSKEEEMGFGESVQGYLKMSDLHFDFDSVVGDNWHFDEIANYWQTHFDIREYMLWFEVTS